MMKFPLRVPSGLAASEREYFQLAPPPPLRSFPIRRRPPSTLRLAGFGRGADRRPPSVPLLLSRRWWRPERRRRGLDWPTPCSPQPTRTTRPLLRPRRRPPSSLQVCHLPSSLPLSVSRPTPCAPPPPPTRTMSLFSGRAAVPPPSPPSSPLQSRFAALLAARLHVQHHGEWAVGSF